TAGLPKDEDIDTRKRKFRLRILIMLQKIVTIRDSIDSLHLAMSIFAGHGVMECFSALPRLLRDAMINEQWEGPRNLLLNQIHHDLQRVSDWYPAAEFAADILTRGDSALVAEFEHFIEHGKSMLQSDEARRMCPEPIEA
ncbi:MAG: acyl-CoA dehydrogenase, partial [Armatimonadetes bacterium]|nr:acyl-CoA dehydrogenase [Armatimonadota bacterium]